MPITRPPRTTAPCPVVRSTGTSHAFDGVPAGGALGVGDAEGCDGGGVREGVGVDGDDAAGVGTVVAALARGPRRSTTYQAPPVAAATVPRPNRPVRTLRRLGLGVDAFVGSPGGVGVAAATGDGDGAGADSWAAAC